MLSAVQVHTWVHSLILSVILLERYYEPHLQVGKLRLRDPRSMAEIWKAVCAVVHGLRGGVASFPGFCPLGSSLIWPSLGPGESGGGPSGRQGSQSRGSRQTPGMGAASSKGWVGPLLGSRSLRPGLQGVGLG